MQEGVCVTAEDLKRLRRRFVAAVVAGAATLGSCLAQDIPGYPRNVDAFDRREVALLPKYCIYTQLFRTGVSGANDQAMIKAWSAQMGAIFNDMHHYCFGLMKTNRGMFLSRDSTSRRFYLSDAIGEFDYVINRAPEDFVLLPEIVTKKGEVLLQLGRGPLAEFEFERAIELKVDYWPPYAYLSDYHKQSGDIVKARQILESGLAQVPNAKGLQRRFAELDAAPGRPPAR